MNQSTRQPSAVVQGAPGQVHSRQDARTRIPQLVRTAAELREAQTRLLAAAVAEPGCEAARPSVGLVTTMGALHAGHAALAAAARTENDVVVASIFINPLQFGEAEDLDRYPRTLDADLAALGAAGVDLVFAPAVGEVYPHGLPRIRISAGDLGGVFEGSTRPGHFDGALTVVAKLLHMAAPVVRADFRAYFGQKDAQQLALVRRMVRDLDFPVRIIDVPTVRDDDGLALSSRNRFLSGAEREAALVLPRGLAELAGRAAAREPLRIPETAELVASEPLVQLDYLEVVDPESFEILAENCSETPFQGEALALIAARVGSVHLIDNMMLRSG